MIAKYLWELGSVIILVLGSLHLYYTFFSDKFSSQNGKMIEDMKTSSPNITKKTTMWSAWIGFNASHSSGIMFIGAMNFYFALRYFDVLQPDHFFFLFNILIMAFYVWLAKRYWFKIPFLGASITFSCFLISYILTLLA